MNEIGHQEFKNQVFAEFCELIFLYSVKTSKSQTEIFSLIVKV